MAEKMSVRGSEQMKSRKPFLLRCIQRTGQKGKDT